MCRHRKWTGAPRRMPGGLVGSLIWILIIMLATVHQIGGLFGQQRLGALVESKTYYYPRKRDHPHHLRVSENYKNDFVHETRNAATINGTKYEFHMSPSTTNHDELIFEALHKVYQHRLAPFYVHHYDNEDDKRLSSDPRLVSPNACARDLMYLLDKLPAMTKKSHPAEDSDKYLTPIDQDEISPELAAFFDSYARSEAGVLMGNTYWVGSHEQCVDRHIFEVVNSRPRATNLQQPGLSSAYGNVSATDQQVISFRGRYCVSALKSSKWDSMISAKKLRLRNYFKSERQLNDYSQVFRLQIGICLPSSCDSSSLERHYDEIDLLTKALLEHRFSDYKLIDLYCLPDETSPLRAWSGSALYFFTLIAAWCSLLLLATLVDFMDLVDSIPNKTLSSEALKSGPKVAGAPRATRMQKFVAWFSLRANYHKFMKVSDNNSGSNSGKQKQQHPPRKQQLAGHQPSSSEPAKASGGAGASAAAAAAAKSADDGPRLKIDLRFLNALKAFCMFWIVNSHIMLLTIQTSKNILFSDGLLNGFMHFLIGGSFAVDLFFTVTGFITAFLMFDSGHARRLRPAAWLYLYFHRYWRLAPMYLLAFWFSRSVVQLLSSGPLWDYGTAHVTFRGLCNTESWWYPLTLSSNLHGLSEECMITTWYISCDMQFFLVSPIFIYLLARSPLAGVAASVATIVVSSKLRFDSIFNDQGSFRYDELIKPRADVFMRVSYDSPALYTHPHYRISSYLVGLLAGHYVYMVKYGKWSSPIAVDCEQLASGPPTTSANSYAPATTTSKPRQSLVNAPYSEKLLANGRRLRAALAYFGVLASLIMTFISYLLSNYYPTSLLKYSQTLAACAYSVDHLAMSIGASLIITTMCFGQWPLLAKFCSAPFWTRISKINYALLLLQCEAIYFQLFRYDQVPLAGTREVINLLFNILVTLYPVAFLVTLALEFPLANLEKLLV